MFLVNLGFSYSKFRNVVRFTGINLLVACSEGSSYSQRSTKREVSTPEGLGGVSGECGFKKTLLSVPTTL